MNFDQPPIFCYTNLVTAKSHRPPNMGTHDTLERVGNQGNLLGARSVAGTDRTAIGRFHPGSTGSSLLIAVCVLVM